jgi:hypothetical protein
VREPKTLMVMGAGKLGGAVVDLLACRRPEHRYVVVARDGERLARRLNLTRYMCAQWGRFPEVHGEVTDLLDIERTADVLARHQPDLVFNATTPFPWWLIDEMPEAARTLAHAAGPGMWCALDCLLPEALDRALRAADVPVTLVNACYPDMVNAFLSDSPHAPVAGIGNLSNLIPGLQLAFGTALETDPQDVTIRLVCHHYTSLNCPTWGDDRGAPYSLTVDHPGGMLRFGPGDPEPFALMKAAMPRVRGLDGLGVTVSSAATVLATILDGDRRRHHVPGVGGRPGGYPVQISEGGRFELDLPPGIDEAAAVRINEQAQRHDGVASVTAGSVTATEAAREAFAHIVGFDLKPISRENVKSVSVMMIARLNDLYALNLADAASIRAQVE